MTDRLQFTVPGLAPASFSGNSRVHWRKRHQDGDEYAERVVCAFWTCGSAATVWPQRRYGARDAGPIPWQKARLTLTQRACKPRDVDNFLASFKPGLDTLTTKGKRPLGIILDDSPEHLSIAVRTERVKHKADELVVIEIEREA